MTAKPDPKPDAAHADVVHLKKCPFCGGTNIVPLAVPGASRSKEDRRHLMWCKGCGADGPFSETEGGAPEAWNKRAG